MEMTADSSLWYVTFGPDHRLAGGRVQRQERGGIALRRKYVVISAPGEEAARHAALALLGPGGWAAVYDATAGRAVAARPGMGRLFPFAIEYPA